MLVSDVVTGAAKCTDRIFYKPLEDGAHDWAKMLQQLQNIPCDRLEDTGAVVAAKGFDIRAEADKLRKMYLK